MLNVLDPDEAAATLGHYLLDFAEQLPPGPTEGDRIKPKDPIKGPTKGAKQAAKQSPAETYDARTYGHWHVNRATECVVRAQTARRREALKPHLRVVAPALMRVLSKVQESLERVPVRADLADYTVTTLTLNYKP